MLLERCSTDWKDLQHDRDPQRAGQKRIYSGPEDCPGDPPPCSWDGDRCRICTKRRIDNPELARMMRIAQMMNAGMQLDSEMLSREQWLVLSEIRGGMPRWPI